MMGTERDSYGEVSVGVLLLGFFLLTMPVSALAQDLPEPTKSVDDIARELSNPVGSTASLVFQGNYAQLGGTAPGVSDQSSTSLVILPTLPFKLGSGNLTVRPSFPVVGAPIIGESGE